MKRVTIHRTARGEVRKAVNHYEDQALGLGLGFLAELQAGIERIRTHPEACPPYQRTKYRKGFLERFNYTVIFRELADIPFIIAVAHGSRRPDYWRRRSPNDPGATAFPLDS